MKSAESIDVENEVAADCRASIASQMGLLSSLCQARPSAVRAAARFGTEFM